MYEWGKVKKALGNKTGITSYPWTVWKITNYAPNILTFVSEQIAKTKILQDSDIDLVNSKRDCLPDSNRINHEVARNLQNQSLKLNHELEEIKNSVSSSQFE